MMTVLLWTSGIFVGYRLARILFAPVARVWRERPVVVWDDSDNRWRAADRMGKK